MHLINAINKEHIYMMCI